MGSYNYTSPVNCNPGELGPSLAEFCSASAFVAFITLLESFLRSKEEISGICERVESVEPEDVYDFVVIGGGAAGAVVAARLSEIPSWKVLLLESGPDESVAGQVPMFYKSLLGTVLDWNYTTTNEAHCCLSTNGSCTISAGKMLGGSTSHNALLYSRGIPSDYDNWAAMGNDGWSYEDVLPYYKKGEDNGEIDRVGRKYHGTGGPVRIERLQHLPAFGHSILAAAVEAGFGISEDLNGRDITGFSIIQTTSENGVRRSSATAYLRPIRNRANLDISINSTATKVIIEDGVAVGVRYYKNGKFKTVQVRKEIVVSAGNIESPKLLLLSGVGPKEHLESVGVDVVHDLPGVGENFHDPTSFHVEFTINETDAYEYDWTSVAEYIAYQTGPLSGNGLISVLGNAASTLTTPDSPDIRIGFPDYRTACAPGDKDALRSSGRRTILAYVSNLRPKSRGRVTLASNNPLDYPIIWANYLHEPDDLDRMVQGIRLTLSLAETEALRAHDMTLSSTIVEACSNLTFASYDYWACALRQNAFSYIHHAGACKMGPESDTMAVVDPRLRVRGVKGIRVADTSIMPQVISGNTAAPAMMIGERAAAFIKSDWGREEPEATVDDISVIQNEDYFFFANSSSSRSTADWSTIIRNICYSTTFIIFLIFLFHLLKIYRTSSFHIYGYNGF